MQLNHLHLHVAEVERASSFYRAWFGFRAHVTHGEVLFMRDDAGMDLALAPGPADVMPPWFHFGFRLGNSEAVCALHDDMSAAGVAIAEPLEQAPDFAAFRCTDPDGHLIEVYWEP